MQEEETCLGQALISKMLHLFPVSPLENALLAELFIGSVTATDTGSLSHHFGQHVNNSGCMQVLIALSVVAAVNGVGRRKNE